MKQKSKHWDANGNPILDFFGMREYYKNDVGSMGVLKSKPPHLYVVIPELVMIYNLHQPFTLRVFRIFPAGQTEYLFKLETHHINYLRDVYADKTKGWKHYRVGDDIRYIKKGKLIQYCAQNELPLSGV